MSPAHATSRCAATVILLLGKNIGDSGNEVNTCHFTQSNVMCVIGNWTGKETMWLHCCCVVYGRLLLLLRSLCSVELKGKKHSLRSLYGTLDSSKHQPSLMQCEVSWCVWGEMKQFSFTVSMNGPHINNASSIELSHIYFIRRSRSCNKHTPLAPFNICLRVRVLQWINRK